MTLHPATGATPRVFSVEQTTAQVVWRRRGRPGLGLVEDLDPNTSTTVEVDGAGPVTITTPPPLPGPELFRLATVNDIHIGCDHFGVTGMMREPRQSGQDPHAVRCLRAAVKDALAWGAGMLVVKGDLTHRGTPAQWHAVGEELAGLPVPVAVVPGNHDVNERSEAIAQPELARAGLHLVHGVEVFDRPGLRLILADTTTPNSERGRIGHVADEIIRRAGRTPNAVLVALHHHPQRFRFRTFHPSGVPGPQARRFLRRLREAAPRSLVTTGHSHRHRRRVMEGVTVTEVGSTKDYPGTWTGYVVHAAGLRQVVRRVSDPTCLPWLEHTRWTAAGVWGYWSPGRLEDRCFALEW